LYYLQSRYYDPDIGRFINPDVYFDTFEGEYSTNMFIYCNDDPVNKVDPSGEWAEFFTWLFGYDAVRTEVRIFRSGNTTSCEIYFHFSGTIKVRGVKFHCFSEYNSSSGTNYNRIRASRSYRSFSFGAMANGWYRLAEVKIPKSVSYVKISITDFHLYYINPGKWAYQGVVSGKSR
jgi:hypothetical protein